MLLEAHYGVPMARGCAERHPIFALDPATISFILGHSEAKIFMVDTSLRKPRRQP